MLGKEKTNLETQKNKDEDVPLYYYLIASARNIAGELLMYLITRATILSLLHKNAWSSSYRNLMSIYMYITLVLFTLGIIASYSIKKIIGRFNHTIYLHYEIIITLILAVLLEIFFLN